ncbi:conserved membrane hypothetical protein [Vibrio chagasii]|uniref:hypothetical protein n=1 Tax=Vibrio fortis TaxID=212667 RepID=UPI0033728DF7|nr:conserved membrane hypothetical protein [Vibrio chagasii]CAH7220851.1 conserved membrane hypothetical protein [Vibrio chagasii]
MDKLSKTTLVIIFVLMSVIGVFSVDRSDVLSRSQDEHLLVFAYLLSGIMTTYVMLYTAIQIYKQCIKNTKLKEVFSILGFSGLVFVVYGVAWFLVKHIAKSPLVG